MSTDKIIDSLMHFAERLDRLENALNDSKKNKLHFDIHINELHLNELNLEELAFHLEKLDIQELSGMLNMGNTFSPKVHQKKKLDAAASGSHSASFKDKEYVPKESMETESRPEACLKTEKGSRDIQILINGDPVSYSLINGEGNHDD
ncbi:hypothetical protein [Bacillus sp. FJAT-27245]|uniref:hypothetical protein n=1 Tax=Bacillus sp. FJAT-27245 TaxID=1684144 RepID=UPI0006A7C8E6|nr:hypothetical protein [Bacillus sp. FJAT-27245]